jgi:4-hydroxythreonine-4-phosphate dehydrogenase
VRLHVTADDRTGALEVAATLADRHAGGLTGVTVEVWPAAPSDDVVVVDLESRHCPPEEARSRAASLPTTGACAHKFDSTLRGNWAVELVQRSAAGSRPVLVVPALPALGRVCVDGVVLVGGRPLHESDAGSDVRRAVTSSRPADHLAAAGFNTVRGLSCLDEVEEWLEAPDGIAVADAATDDDLRRIASAWSGHDRVLLAGTSAAIGAAAGPVRTVLAGSVPGPFLVVCGSASALARRQVDAAVAEGAVLATDAETAGDALRSGRHVVIAAEHRTAAIDDGAAEAMAVELAERARSIAHSGGAPKAVMVIGGDTAAALLGGAQVRVLGSVAPGTAWVDSPAFEQPVITRAGAFGSDRALATLLRGTLRS